MSCKHETQVQAWYDNELPAGQRAAMESHLGECRECAELLAELKQLSSVLVTSSRASMGPDAKRRLEQAWWRQRDRGVLRLAEWLTAAAAAIIVLSLLFWSDESGRTDSPTQQAIAWQPAAVMPPSDGRDEPASDVVVLAEWMANDLSTEAGQ